MPILRSWSDYQAERTRQYWRHMFNENMDVYEFSPRHREIAGLLVKGKANGEIAHALGIAENTVKNHLTLMYANTGTQDRIQLALRLIGVSTEEDAS